MSLEDKSEFVSATFNHLVNFIHEIETNNYFDPKQLTEAQRAMETLFNEFSFLKNKLDYLKYGYFNEFLDEVI